MPVGNDAAVELLPSPEQREEVYHRIRAFRQTKAIFSMDFQMMLSMWEDVLPVVAAISISMQKVM